MKLSILTCTTVDRRAEFRTLRRVFDSLIPPGEVQFLYEEDNKQMSVGRKRQILLERAVGDYVVYFDSDDMPRANYIVDILSAIEDQPDCVGFLIQMTTNGRNPQICCHSLKYKQWAVKVDGYDFVRNVTHFNPVRRELALSVGFEDRRFGEDKVYSDKLTPLCKSEVFINKVLFDYRYSNKIPHNKKYGIRK